MADFCTNCAREMWDEDFEPEINIEKISESLAPDTYLPVLCEGCGMRAISKTQKGTILIAVLDDEMEETNWIDLENWPTAWEARWRKF